MLRLIIARWLILISIIFYLIAAIFGQEKLLMLIGRLFECFHYLSRILGSSITLSISFSLRWSHVLLGIGASGWALLLLAHYFYSRRYRRLRLSNAQLEQQKLDIVEVPLELEMTNEGDRPLEKSLDAQTSFESTYVLISSFTSFCLEIFKFADRDSKCFGGGGAFEEFYSAFLSSLKVILRGILASSCSFQIFELLEKQIIASLIGSIKEERLEKGQETSEVDPTSRKMRFIAVVDGHVEVGIRQGSAESDMIILNELGPCDVATSLMDLLKMLGCHSGTDNLEGSQQLVFVKALTDSVVLMTIPEEAFANLRNNFEKEAAVHIVHLILLRFNRVTMQTISKYFGMNQEAVRLFERMVEDISPFIPTLQQVSEVSQNLSLFERLFTCPSTSIVKASLGHRKRKKSRYPAYIELNDPELMFESTTTEDRQHAQESILIAAFKIFGNHTKENILSMTNGHNLSKSIRFCVVPAGEIIQKREETKDLLLIIHGTVKLSEDAKQTAYYTFGPGSLIGLPNLFLGSTMNINVQSCSICLIALIPRDIFDVYTNRYPTAIFTLASKLLKGISPLIKMIDLAVDWRDVASGQVYTRKGEMPSHKISVIVHGRMRGLAAFPVEEQYQECQGSPRTGETLRLKAEYGPGEAIGELSVLSSSPWTETVYATRDTEIATIPRHLFDALGRLGMVAGLARMIAERWVMATSSKTHLDNMAHISDDWYQRPVSYFRTITVMPVDTGMADVARRFVQQFCKALRAHGNVCLLTLELVTSHLGRHVFSPIGTVKLMEWLNQLEDQHRVLVYFVAPDAPHSPWTRRCIRQADGIFLVAPAPQNGESILSGAFEAVLAGMHSMARREIVLVHRDRQIKPGATRAVGSETVHHVYDPGCFSTRTLTIHQNADILQRMIRHVFPEKEDDQNHSQISSQNDYARLARRVVGAGVGVVLSGGGARGFAHVGVLEALTNAGVPVDCIGGSSMGALVSSVYAREANLLRTRATVGTFAGRMSNPWRYLLDLTYPVTSWFTGHAFNRAVWKAVGEVLISDLWIPFYAASTDLRHSRLAVPRCGYVWRSVRASMSLAGLVPPICEGTGMLVDGGYLDNLPVETITEVAPWCSTIIAVDVGTPADDEPREFGDTVSGWRNLIMHAFGISTAVPTLADIQARLAYVSCVGRLNQVQRLACWKSKPSGRGDSKWYKHYQPHDHQPKEDGDNKNRTPRCPQIFYLRPPVGHIGTLSFRRYAEAVQLGRSYGEEVLAEWQTEGISMGFQKRIPSAADSPKTEETHFEPNPPAYGRKSLGFQQALIDDSSVPPRRRMSI